MNRRHGEGGHREPSGTWRTWRAMIQRCLHRGAADFPGYGGRGITVCDRWRVFENFRDDMGPRPPGATIERIDNDGGYEPGNCRWATWREQANNKRTNRRLSHAGVTLTMAEWAEKLGIRYGTLSERLRRGWPIADALTHPLCPGVRPFAMTAAAERAAEEEHHG